MAADSASITGLQATDAEAAAIESPRSMQSDAGFLSLRGVTRRFGEVVAVDDVSLDLADGEFVCFLGPSGCGKTTLLRAVAGLEATDAGEIRLRGRDLAGVPARLRNFGVVFQSYSLFPNMTIARNVAYGLECRRRPRAEIDRRVSEMLELVQLTDQALKYPEQLSGGQQQRVALARALAPNPGVLLLDEPLSALDAKVREELRGEIRDVQKALGITTIMVTHDQDEAMEMADRIVVMDRGKIAQIGSATELYSAPASRFVAEFIGRMNTLRAEIDGDRARVGDFVLALAPAIAGDRGSGARTLGIRPEEVELCAADAEVENRIDGIVERSVFLGNVTRLTLEVAGQRLVVELRGRPADVERGQRLSLRLPAQALHLLDD